MNAFRKIFISTASLVCLALIVLLVVENWNVTITLQFTGNSWPGVSLGLILLVTALLGSLSVFLRLWDITRRQQQTLKQAELRKEKAEVKAESSSGQIQALESKIKTLEKALEQALSSPQARKDR